MVARMETRWSHRDELSGLTIAACLALAAAVALRSIGVPQVDLHGPLHYLGIMDPLCGGTRATFLLLAGDPLGAARYNPLVFPLGVLVAAVLVRAGFGSLSGRWLELRISHGARRVLLVALAVMVVALAVRQQWHAELLMQGWPPPEAMPR